MEDTKYLNTFLYIAAILFIIGELIDWITFTFSRKPFYKRLLASALTSAPVDSIIFLHMLNRLNFGSLSLIVLGKVAGILMICQLWRKAARPIIGRP